MIVLSKIVFICFKHKLEVFQKNFYTFCAKVWVLVQADRRFVKPCLRLILGLFLRTLGCIFNQHLATLQAGCSPCLLLNNLVASCVALPAFPLAKRKSASSVQCKLCSKLQAVEYAGFLVVDLCRWVFLQVE